MVNRDKALQHGTFLHDSGRVEESVYWYRKVLESEPENIEALVRIGFALQTLGKLEEAVVCFEKVIILKPDSLENHYTLANGLQEVGRWQEAIACYEKIIKLQPDAVEAYNELGIVYKKQGKIDNSISRYRQAIAINPNYFACYNNLGSALQERGDYEDAIACYRKALEINPDSVEVHSNLGSALKRHCNFQEAISIYQNLITIEPDNAEAYFQLGNCNKELGNFQKAVLSYQSAIAINCNYVEAFSNLAAVQNEQGDVLAATASCKKAISINPNYANAYINLGFALQKQGRLEEASISVRKAISLQSDNARFYYNMGVVLSDQGEIEDAVANYKKALSIRADDAGSFGNLLLAMQYLPGQSLENLLLIHQKWADTFYGKSSLPLSSYDNIVSEDRKLRIGLVSPDFGEHPIGYFLLGFIEHYPTKELEITCYSARMPDDMTRRFMECSDHWVETRLIDDEQLENRIRDDKIDILIDLSGHTSLNKLPLFARKPAPIQITWAGYVGTTGLPEMDWLIADSHHIAHGEEIYYSEKIIRLPDSWLCYSPPENVPIFLKTKTTGDGDRFVLGNFGSSKKINEQMLDAWSRILKECPQSDLLLIYKNMDNPTNVKRILNFFDKAGIDVERITIEGWLPHKELLARYNSVDLALDTLPYSGGITTMEALWMGVPVVTARGKTFAGRHSTSMLRTLGLQQLVTDDLDGYSKLVINLVNNQKQLQIIRDGLRDRLLNSPLCDYEKFSVDLTLELRKVWRQWCKTGKQTC
ncbi:MAG: tetratricopeptide repeat protein [Magnetococcales bacterium]|nr:tetratricopeptide repeat protein [Magnetococcales bacterium]